MADGKISADPNLASPAAGDQIPIVDISVVDSLKNKTITWSQITALNWTVADITDLTNGVEALTTAEVNQLENIGTTVITSSDWTAVSNLSGVNTGDVTYDNTDFVDLTSVQTKAGALTLSDTLTLNGPYLAMSPTGGKDLGIRMGNVGFFPFSASSGHPTFQSRVLNGATILRVMPNGTSTTAQFEFFRTDYYSDTANWENFKITSGTEFIFETTKAGTGVARSMQWRVGANTDQMVLETNGSITMSGALSAAGFYRGGTDSSTGVVRLRDSDAIGWRNTGNTGDKLIIGNASGLEFRFSGFSEYTFDAIAANFFDNSITTTGDLSAGAIIGTSFGAILSNNLLDKSATEVVSGNWNYSGASIGSARGLNGRYTDVGGTAFFGAQIWTIDSSSWDSGASGNSWTPSNMYGIAWVRGSNASARANIGEGLYTFVNGGFDSGMGANGIETVGKITAAGVIAGSSITGANVTSGANPGHTHTGSSISSLDATDITTGTLAVARGGTGVTTSSGSGANALGTVSQTNVASTITQRNSSSDIACRLLRMEYTTTNANCNYFLTQVAVGTGDNYSRPATVAQVQTKLGVVSQLVAVKTADESVTSSTTFQADNHLSVTVAASTRYSVFLTLVVNGSSSYDLKVGWTYPTGATMHWLAIDATSGGSAQAITGSRTIQLNGATNQILTYRGVLNVTTGGTFNLRWAQAVNGPTASIIRAGSTLQLLAMN